MIQVLGVSRCSRSFNPAGSLTLRGTSWLIALTNAMIFDEYVSLLRALISKCKKAGIRAAKEGAAEAFTAHIPLPAANSASKTIRVVFNALSAVYRDMPEIAGWDENGYAYVGVLACAHNSGEFSLESAAWSGEGAESTKAQRFIAQAVERPCSLNFCSEAGQSPEPMSVFV